LSYVAGISALRKFVDLLPDKDRREVTKEILEKFLPISIINMISNDTIESPVLECPISISKLDDSCQQMTSSLSGISLGISPKGSINFISSIA
jgi:hypothetical protein